MKTLLLATAFGTMMLVWAGALEAHNDQPPQAGAAVLLAGR